MSRRASPSRLRECSRSFASSSPRGNVIDPGFVGVIIGGAFGKIVSSLVSDVLMPPLGLLLGKIDFSNLFLNLGDKPAKTLAEAKALGVPTLNYGQFIDNIIQFFILAFVVFLIVRMVTKLYKKPEVPAATKPRAPSAPRPFPSRRRNAATAPRTWLRPERRDERSNASDSFDASRSVPAEILAAHREDGASRGRPGMASDRKTCASSSLKGCGSSGRSTSSGARATTSSSVTLG